MRSAVASRSQPLDASPRRQEAEFRKDVLSAEDVLDPASRIHPPSQEDELYYWAEDVLDPKDVHDYASSEQEAGPSEPPSQEAELSLFPREDALDPENVPEDVHVSSERESQETELSLFRRKDVLDPEEASKLREWIFGSGSTGAHHLARRIIQTVLYIYDSYPYSELIRDYMPQPFKTMDQFNQIQLEQRFPHDFDYQKVLYDLKPEDALSARKRSKHPGLAHFLDQHEIIARYLVCRPAVLKLARNALINWKQLGLGIKDHDCWSYLEYIGHPRAVKWLSRVFPGQSSLHLVAKQLDDIERQRYPHLREHVGLKVWEGLSPQSVLRLMEESQKIGYIKEEWLGDDPLTLVALPVIKSQVEIVDDWTDFDICMHEHDDMHEHDNFEMLGPLLKKHDKKMFKNKFPFGKSSVSAAHKQLKLLACRLLEVYLCLPGGVRLDLPPPLQCNFYISAVRERLSRGVEIGMEKIQTPFACGELEDLFLKAREAKVPCKCCSPILTTILESRNMAAKAYLCRAQCVTLAYPILRKWRMEDGFWKSWADKPSLPITGVAPQLLDQIEMEKGAIPYELQMALLPDAAKAKKCGLIKDEWLDGDVLASACLSVIDSSD